MIKKNTENMNEKENKDEEEAIIHKIEQELSIFITVDNLLKAAGSIDHACFDFRLDWD